MSKTSFIIFPPLLSFRYEREKREEHQYQVPIAAADNFDYVMDMDEAPKPYRYVQLFSWSLAASMRLKENKLLKYLELTAIFLSHPQIILNLIQSYSI